MCLLLDMIMQEKIESSTITVPVPNYKEYTTVQFRFVETQTEARRPWAVSSQPTLSQMYRSMHKELRTGALRSIVRQSGISKQEFE